MFGLSLIHAGFLAAAAAVTIPILIHLLLRPRARQVSIGTLRFLRLAIKETRHRRRIRRWLLLAMRVAAVLLLALLFARPYLTAATSGIGQDCEVIVLVDRSGSMAAMYSGENLFSCASGGGKDPRRRSARDEGPSGLLRRSRRDGESRGPDRFAAPARLCGHRFRPGAVLGTRRLLDVEPAAPQALSDHRSSTHRPAHRRQGISRGRGGRGGRGGQAADGQPGRREGRGRAADDPPSRANRRERAGVECRSVACPQRSSAAAAGGERGEAGGPIEDGLDRGRRRRSR